MDTLLASKQESILREADVIADPEAECSELSFEYR